MHQPAIRPDAPRSTSPHTAREPAMTKRPFKPAQLRLAAVAIAAMTVASPARAAFDAAAIISWGQSFIPYVVQYIVGQAEQALFGGMVDGTDKMVAAVEKNTGAQKEIGQAMINYEAALVANTRAIKANEDFASVRASVYNHCQSMMLAKRGVGIAAARGIAAKGKTAADVGRWLYQDPARMLAQTIEEHNTTFCTEGDARRGRCTAAKASMQGANMNAGSLLTPVAGDTYTPDEQLASDSFIRMVVDPVPEGQLPASLERTPAGQRYRVEHMASAAQLSMVKHSLNQIAAARSPDGELMPGGAGAGGSGISMVGHMKKFVEDRFGNPQYNQSLSTRNELGLLREVAHSLAANNYFAFQSYKQQERTEALLATHLALATRERAERKLGEARATATTPRLRADNVN